MYRGRFRVVNMFYNPRYRQSDLRPRPYLILPLFHLIVPELPLFYP